MKILIAPDKFKASLTAQEVIRSLTEGLKESIPTAQIIGHPMADGGDGSLKVIENLLDLQSHNCQTFDPLMRPIKATYRRSSTTAFIELASASGLVLLSTSEQNPLLTTSRGTGEMIAAAIANGVRQIYLFLGGSATNDAAMGIASALGYQFLDKDNRPLAPIGAKLIQVSKIHREPKDSLSKVKFTLLCDVINPMYGPDGAAFVYAEQKGANGAAVKLLDDGLQHFAGLIKKWNGNDLSHLPGGGAAGGIAAGLAGLLGAELRQGFDVIAELTHLEKQIQQADVVISGEGKLDEQSLQGKVVHGVAKLCKQYKKPLYLVVGKNELSAQAEQKLACQYVDSIMNYADSKGQAMSSAAFFLKKMASESLAPVLLKADNQLL